MTYRDWVASVLAAAVLIPLLLHLRRPKQPSASWRALLEHPHRPHVQWPWRPYDWERDGQ